MDYDLARLDYAICGITYPDTLKILPPSGQKSDQKFAVGDKNGVLQCLSIKEEEPVVQFKTLPGKPITAVQLASGVGTQADKIFTASGNEVKGYTRKGKVFLSIETALSETITSMCILGSDLILCSGRNVTYYRDLREYHSYICEDRVLDIAAFASHRIRLLVLIANKGAIILENGKLISRTPISSGPSRLIVPLSTHVTDIQAFFGSSDGSLGLIGYQENEVARLEKQTSNERERYQRSTHSLQSGLSTPPLIDVQHEEATSDLLASVRCQAGTRRVWVKIRYVADGSVETKLGGIRVLIYVLPAGAPRVARLITLKLPALPYYSQHEQQEWNMESQERVWCQLHVSGSFSVAEITSWLTEALPGELPRPAANVSFVRSHALLKTILICQYQRGSAVLKSDNVSTIATLRNIVSNCSVEKSIRVDLSCDIPKNCCMTSFKYLEDKFKLEYQKHKDIILKNAISQKAYIGLDFEPRKFDIFQTSKFFSKLDLDSSMSEEGPILCQDYSRVWDSRETINGTQFGELVVGGTNMTNHDQDLDKRKLVKTQ
ncbi:unnamed protein product [Arctia plantaginis]|uniref:Uncharacterized protein n=1 Tax=Arctia plantaginis TaxID=874455 RepID=A0A8S0Z6R1_ARCPL|nr:unnamed protein product [Arctia plantaginis]CAB3236189.1 unnamed protein product [Arctia plantaginis]